MPPRAPSARPAGICRFSLTEQEYSVCSILVFGLWYVVSVRSVGSVRSVVSLSAKSRHMMHMRLMRVLPAGVRLRGSRLESRTQEHNLPMKVFIPVTTC